MTQAEHGNLRGAIRRVALERGWHVDSNGPVQVAGRHDLTLCIDGRYVSVEVKTGRGKQTPAQQRYSEQVRRAGGQVIEARTLRQFIKEAETSVGNTTESPWLRIKRNDPRALALADRHYSRRTPGSKSFVQNARSLVLLSRDETALWVTIWPYAEFVKHQWKDAWQCSMFRNEGSALSSDLIRAAVAETVAYHRSGENPKWSKDPPPSGGFITFVDDAKIRKKRDPGRCFVKAGWTRLKERTGSNLTVLHLPLEDIIQEAEMPSIDAWFQLAQSGIEAINNLADAIKGFETPTAQGPSAMAQPIDIRTFEPEPGPIEANGDEKPKRRGRPPGSKNKKQQEDGIPESLDDTIELAVGESPETPIDESDIEDLIGSLDLD